MVAMLQFEQDSNPAQKLNWRDGWGTFVQYKGTRLALEKSGCVAAFLLKELSKQL